MTSSFEGDPNNFIRENYIFPENDAEQYDVKLRQYLNAMAAAVNSKDSGLYLDEETITGQQFVPLFGTTTSSSLVFRDVFRTVIDFGVLPDTTTKTVAHGITTNQNFSVVKIYGAATDPAASTLQSGIPLPFVNVTTPTDGVQLEMDATNISITTTTSNYTGYIRSFVIVEYMKVISLT